MPPTFALTRRLILAIPVLAASPGSAAGGCRPQVLFVCPAGTVKSAIAREMLRGRAEARRIPVRVASRGLNPEDHVSPTLAARLRVDGLDPAREPARALAASDLRGADVVIAFDEAATSPRLRGARVWATPSWNADYEAAKAQTAARIDALLDELAASPCQGAGR